MSPLAASLQANVSFALFLLIAAFGFVLGFFTIRGSGINNHPTDGRDGAPGSKLPDEFHQFADRQVHDGDVHRAQRDVRIHAREAEMEASGREPPSWHVPHPHLRHHAAAEEEMTIDDINRRLAAEARARTEARQRQDDANRTARR